MTKTERELLRHLAESYAFISDLRKSAQWSNNTYLLAQTEGIEQRVANRRKEYPVSFQRYYNAALKRGTAARLAALSDKEKPSVTVPKTFVQPKKKAEDKSRKRRPVVGNRLPKLE